jgi:hypothetical protein
MKHIQWLNGLEKLVLKVSESLAHYDNAVPWYGMKSKSKSEVHSNVFSAE